MNGSSHDLGGSESAAEEVWEVRIAATLIIHFLPACLAVRRNFPISLLTVFCLKHVFGFLPLLLFLKRFIEPLPRDINSENGWSSGKNRI